MKVGELYFTLGLTPDSSWGRMRGMLSGLRNQMRTVGGGVGGGGGGGRGSRRGAEGFGPDFPDGHFFGPASAHRRDGTNRSINWAKDTGDPFNVGGTGGRGRNGKTPGPPPTWFKRLREGVNDLNLFRRALYGTFAVQTVQTVAELSDAYTNMHNRLRVLTGSQEEAEKQYQKGREVATATRSDLESTIEGYVRVSSATKELGMTSEQTWSFVTSVQQAMAMSGATASEAKSGMTQFTQALSKGTLDGDEFKSLAENMPNILTLLAKALGKTEGQIRSMSKSGELTRKVIVNAFTKMKDSIASDFGATVPTVAQQFTAFKNEMIDATGKFAKVVHLTELAGVVFRAFGLAIKLVLGLLTIVLWPINKLIEGFTFLWKAATDGSDAALAVLLGIGTALAAFIIPNLLFLVDIIAVTVIPALYRMAVAAWASLGPYAAIVAAAAVIAYGIIKIARHWDEVKAAGQEAWEAIKYGFEAAFNYISGLPVIKQLVWLVEKLEGLTGLGSAIGSGAGGALGMAQNALGVVPTVPTDRWGAPIQNVNDAAGAPIQNVNDAAGGAGGAGKNVSVGPTTVNIYATDAADAKRKFDKDQLDRQNRHAAAAFSR